MERISETVVKCTVIFIPVEKLTINDNNNNNVLSVWCFLFCICTGFVVYLCLCALVLLNMHINTNPLNWTELLTATAIILCSKAN